MLHLNGNNSSGRKGGAAAFQFIDTFTKEAGTYVENLYSNKQS
jgi:hypothetical protein